MTALLSNESNSVIKGLLEEQSIFAIDEFLQVDNDLSVLKQNLHNKLESEECVWFSRSKCSVCILDESELQKEQDNMIYCQKGDHIIHTRCALVDPTEISENVVDYVCFNCSGHSSVQVIEQIEKRNLFIT